MKKIITAIIVSTVLFGAVSTYAGPPPGGWSKQRPLATIEDFKDLKKGDQIALVCKKCETVSIQEVKRDGMDYCADGAKYNCPTCLVGSKVIHRGPRTHNQSVKLITDHGESCMFLTKINQSGASKSHHGPRK